MILKKEPLIKKQLSILLVGLGLILLLMVWNDCSWIKTLPLYGTELPPDVYQAVIIRSTAVALSIIIISLAVFLGLWKYTITKLEQLSASIDRIMDGDPAAISNNNEEGILSRLEAQSYQMSRRLQLGLESMSREKEGLQSLVTDISHQIKTPLASIKVFNALLIEGGLSEEEEREFLVKIKEQVDKLEWLAAALIKISRMETGMVELRMEPGDIKQTIMEAVNEVYVRALEKNIAINVQNLPSIRVLHDPKWSREAMVNILENSIKYLPEKGQINISVERLETYLKIDFEDDGIGIPAHEMDKVFNRFFRGEADIIKKAEGSGIGLYLCRKIIEEQGGGIIVTSTEGQGAKFTLLLTL